jgi:predicted NAD/FAD-dependent oxidoreductase
MPKFTDDTVLDAALAEAATAVRMSVTTALPANYAGIAAVSLGNVAMTNGLGGGDFGAAANGDVSGRKTTVAAQVISSASASGSATHITLETGSVLKHATTCTSQPVTSGNQINIPAFDIEFLDVTA